MNQIKVTNAKTLVAKESIIANGETNDCMVYATASAFELTYDEAHPIVKERFKRQDRRGTNMLGIINGMRHLADTRESINGKFIREIVSHPKKTYHLHGRDIERKNRVSTFIKEHSEGTYLILTSNHALTIKDGTMIDNIPNGSAKAYVNKAFKVEKLITFQP
jgi:phosphoribosylformylglycinamidine (FGAM) synthase-like amidotransferase family enzyme